MFISKIIIILWNIFSFIPQNNYSHFYSFVYSLFIKLISRKCWDKKLNSLYWKIIPISMVFFFGLLNSIEIISQFSHHIFCYIYTDNIFPVLIYIHFIQILEPILHYFLFNIFPKTNNKNYTFFFHFTLCCEEWWKIMNVGIYEFYFYFTSRKSNGQKIWKQKPKKKWIKVFQQIK